MQLLIDGILKFPINYPRLHRFLNECPGKIDMTRISVPYIRQYEGWWYGWVLIAESHITVSVKDNVYAFIDIFSCKEFDSYKASSYASRALGLSLYQDITILEHRGNIMSTKEG